MLSRCVNAGDQKSEAAESGNVLFLILIAVALFAALSYAVTQSTRGGGGSASKETDLINSAQITQYPAAVKTAIIRMVIKGTSYQNLEFNLPGDFENCTGGTAGTPTHKFCVFHPDGGDATYSAAPGALMVNSAPGPWYFNLEAEVEDIGTSTDGNLSGNDLIAYLPGIQQTLCNRINEALAIDDSTEANITLNASRSGRYELNMVGDEDGGPTYDLPTDEFMIGTSGGAPSLDGQPFGCFRDGGGSGDYVYYHVLVEQ